MHQLRILNPEHDFSIGFRNLLCWPFLPPISPNDFNIGICLAISICLACNSAPQVLLNKVCFDANGPFVEICVIQQGKVRGLVFRWHIRHKQCFVHWTSICVFVLDFVRGNSSTRVSWFSLWRPISRFDAYTSASRPNTYLYPNNAQPLVTHHLTYVYRLTHLRTWLLRNESSLIHHY